MKFADPFFLTAFILVLIPVLIHLLQFKRYKTVYFSQVGFLKTLLNESKKKNRLKQRLILLCRVLAVAFLVMAFARPYIPFGQQTIGTGQSGIGIYIDNSFSMNGLSENGTLLGEAKQKAVDLANSFPPGTRFFLLTNEGPDRQRLQLNKEQLIAAIAKVKSSPKSLRIEQVTALIGRTMDDNAPGSVKNIYLMSDFQKHNCDFRKIEAAPSTHFFLLPFQHVQTNNLRMDTCWLETPGRLQSQTEIMHVRMTNQGTRAYHNIPVKLFLNDSLKAIQSVNLKAGETQETELRFQNLKEGIHYGKLETDDYPIVFDNSFYFSYKVETEVKALAIYSSNDPALGWLEKLFQNDEQVGLSSMSWNQLQISQFSIYQCIYLLNPASISDGLANALIKFVANGGSLVIFPGNSIEPSGYNQFFGRLSASTYGAMSQSERKIEQLNLHHHLFNDVFTRDYDRANLPDIHQSYRMQPPVQNSGTTILTTNDGRTALSEIPYQAGNLYQFSFPLTAEASNLYRHALFVPLIYNMALHSYFPQTIQYTLQTKPVAINLKVEKQVSEPGKLFLKKHGSELQIQLADQDTPSEQIKIKPNDLVREAGFYDLVYKDETIRSLAFNYDRSEAETDYLKMDELKQEAASAGHMTVYESKQANWLSPNNTARNLIGLWKYMILLSLLFLIAELLIIRFWK